MSHVKLVSSPYIRTSLHLSLITLSTSLSHTFYHRWCTTSSSGRCSGGLPAPHTAHCRDHCWSGHVRKNEKKINRERKRDKRRECTEKSSDLAGKGQDSAAGHSEQWVNEAVFHYEQHVEDLHCESTDNEGQGCCGREEGNTMRSEGDHCNNVKAAENIPSKDEVEHGSRREEKGQQDDQAKGTPNVVYTVVDKSKKRKKEKTQGGASATTTQGVCTEEQHYEWSSAFGQDWFGNVVGGKPEDDHGDVE